MSCCWTIVQAVFEFMTQGWASEKGETLAIPTLFLRFICAGWLVLWLKEHSFGMVGFSFFSPTSQVLFLMTHSNCTGTRECRKCGVRSSGGWHLSFIAVLFWMLIWADCPGRATFVYIKHICVYSLSLSHSLSLFSPKKELEGKRDRGRERENPQQA